MKLIGVMSTAVLSLTLGIAAPLYAQQDQQEEQKDKSAQDEKKAQPDKAVKPGEKSAQETNTKPEEKNAQQDKNVKPEERNAQELNPQQARPEVQAQRAGGNGNGRIPDDRFKANFGQEHRFRVSQGDYNNRRFEYGGYSFGFVGAWPSNWLYTQDVYVVDINGAYYLCNASYPGVNIALSITP